MLRSLLFLIFLSVSGLALSSTIPSCSGSATGYVSKASCESNRTIRKDWSGYDSSYCEPQPSNPGRWQIRIGCSCPEGNQLNEDTGMCNPPDCPAGQEKDLLGNCACSGDQIPVMQGIDGELTCQPADTPCDQSSPNYQGHIQDPITGEYAKYCDHSDDWCEEEGSVLGMFNGAYQCMSDNPCKNNGTGIFVEGQCKQGSDNDDGTDTTGKTKETKKDKDGNIIGEKTTEEREDPNTGEKTQVTEEKTFDPDTGEEIDSEKTEKTKEGETGDSAAIEKNTKDTADGIGDLNQTANEINDSLKGTVIHETGVPMSAADVHANFYNTVTAAPIFTAANNISGAFNASAGSCPTYSFNISFLGLGGFTFDYHCQLWPTVAPIISGVMLLLFGFVGIRIVLEA